MAATLAANLAAMCVERGGGPYGHVTRKRINRFVASAAVSRTVTVTGLVAPVSVTFVAAPHEPLIFVATPFHGAWLVIAYAPSTMSVTSAAFVLRLNHNENHWLLNPFERLGRRGMGMMSGLLNIILDVINIDLMMGVLKLGELSKFR